MRREPRTRTGPAPEGELPARVAHWRSQLTGMEHEASSDDDRLALLHELELLQRTSAALAVRLQVGFHASQVAAQVEQGVAPSRAGKAVPDDLALARMTSPYWGSRDLTSARALVGEMPLTLAALGDGVIDDDQARLVTEGTACLSVEDRAEVDRRLVERLAGASTREIRALVSALVYEVDPAGYVRRARRAARDRGVSIRPCPDVMGLLSARLPAPQAIACHQALKEHAQALRAGGDPRTVQQLMADELFARLTGRSVVDGVDVEVGLVITDAALFGGSSDAADLTGFGPVPAEVARELLRPRPSAPVEPDRVGGGRGTDPEPDHGGGAGNDADVGACPDGGRCTDFSCTRLHGAPPSQTRSAPTPPTVPTNGASAVEDDHAAVAAATVWVRRLFTDPPTGRLLARDTRKRLFTGALRELVIARDQTCRNAWCGAPIRHVDHIQRFADRGSTSEDNGQGLCARCNLSRERPRQLHPPPESYRPPPPLLPVFPPGGLTERTVPTAQPDRTDRSHLAPAPASWVPLRSAFVRGGPGLAESALASWLTEHGSRPCHRGTARGAGLPGSHPTTTVPGSALPRHPSAEGDLWHHR